MSQQQQQPVTKTSSVEVMGQMESAPPNRMRHRFSSSSSSNNSSSIGQQANRDDDSVVVTTLQECLFGVPVNPPRKNNHNDSAAVMILDHPPLSHETNSNNGATAAAVAAAAMDSNPPSIKITNDDDETGIVKETAVPNVHPFNNPESEGCSSVGEEEKYATRHVINMQLLRKIVSAGGCCCVVIADNNDEGDDDGGDDEQRLRATTWRVLLNYLPATTDQWSTICHEKRNLYTQLVSDLFADVIDVSVTAEELRGGPQHRRRQNQQKQPSSSQPHSFYATTTVGGGRKVTPIPAHVQQYWKQKALDQNVLNRLTNGLNALLMKDSLLNNNDMFGEGTETSIEGVQAEITEGSSASDALSDFVESALLLDEIRKDVVRTHPDLSFFLEPYNNLGRRRYAALERILFVWSKYNKGVRYVQGMNEIVGILYYVLANDPSAEWSVHAEADTYWLFHALLVEMSDVFVAGLDDQLTGIHGRIHAMEALLARHDPEVKEHLDEMTIAVSFYAIRWWTTLLSREFLLPDTIRLWDSMFASTHKDNFLRYVCVTMVMAVRDKLLMSDFATCLKLLHAFPSTNIEQLLESSRALWIYESQISVACHRGGLSLHQALTTIESPPALIMAFGFPLGIPPVSISSGVVEQQLSERVAKVNVVEATVRSAAQEMLGRAKGLYNWYSIQPQRSQPSAEEDGHPHSPVPAQEGGGEAKENVVEGAGKDEEDDIYFKAIMFS